MFGSSNPFRQPSNSSPFGTQTQSVFGQNNNTSNNPFAPKPFGTSTPFGGQTGSSMFGGTSTGVFGAPQASSPFGASSQAFGSSTPAFRASSAPAFGSSASPFGGTSTFGQKSFGFSTSQPSQSPFGSTTQQKQPAFGNNTFGSSTPFGASNTAFGASNTSAFGASSTPAFGATSTPVFGATNTSGFGATNTPAFGASSTPAFGASSTPSFGATNSPAFGNNAFGGSSTPAFGASSTPAFGASSSPAFGTSNTPAFGASSSPSFSFGSSPAFGQSNSAFGQSTTTFGAQGAQASTPTFGGQSTFGGQQGGSRVMPYAPTTEADSGNSSQLVGKLQSISAMPVHKDKSHEELRWEDYQRGDKGGQLSAGQSSGGTGFGVTNSQLSLFSQSPAFSQTSANQANIFSSSTAANPFGQKTPTATSNMFGQSTTPSMFGSTSSATTSVFGSSPGFATTTSFRSSSASGFSSSPSIFGSAPAQGSTPAFNTGANFNNSQSSSIFSSNPTFGQGQTGSAFGQKINLGFAPTSNFSTPSTGFGNLFSSTSSLTTSTSPFGQTTPAGLTPYQSSQPTQSSGAFGFNNFGQTQIGGMGSSNQNNFGQVSALSNSAVMQPIIPVTNPFGTLPALPQITTAQGGNSPSIQYGISSMPVVDKPTLVRVSSPLTSRHLLQRRVRVPARKYCPGDDGPKVPFFSDVEENSNTPKADALFIPRENPRALFIRPVEREKSSPQKDGLQDNNEKVTSETRDAPTVVKARGVINGSPNGADIVESLMPTLNHSAYFTEPRIQELAAKERVNPGYCKRVKDFVVGRHGYGSIKFLGETDVRKLDLEMLVQFNNREVIVYMDESKKPPVGQGLNKHAEVSLLNIKCIDKKTGKQVKEGSRLEKYKELLKKKTEEQGAQFVSYDAINGEWKFKVEHFSSYKLRNEDDI